MRADPVSLNVPATATTGTAVECADLFDKWVQITGIAGGATFNVEGTIDGTNFVTSGLNGLGPNITANGVYEVPEGFVRIRLNRTVLGSGAPAGTLFARNARTT
jgi:hypothetical protein